MAPTAYSATSSRFAPVSDPLRWGNAMRLPPATIDGERITVHHCRGVNWGGFGGALIDYPSDPRSNASGPHSKRGVWPRGYDDRVSAASPSQPIAGTS